MKKLISAITAIVLLLTLIGCGADSNQKIVGKWYNSGDRCLDIRSDGSWKLDGAYGTGTWKWLDDGVTVEFTDFYGDTQETEIFEDDSGLYIDFDGYFYKDKYPSKKETGATAEQITPPQSTDIKTDQQTTPENPSVSPEQARLQETLKTADNNYANGDYLKALKSYQEALSIDSASQEAKDGVEKAGYAYRTDILSSAEKALTQRNYDSAKETLNEGLSHLPGDSELLAKRNSITDRRIQDSIDDANKLAEAGNWDGAQKALEDIIAENPTNKTVNEAYNDLLNRMPITLKNITTISSDNVSVTKDVIKDRYGNIYDGGVYYVARHSEYVAFGLYNLAEKYTKFNVTAFASTEMENGYIVSISIYLDEQLAYFKDDITNETAPIEISLDVDRKHTLRIEIKLKNPDVRSNEGRIYLGNSSFEKVPQESTPEQPANP